ncbi:MAG TPA: sigma-70 family RNA polymerase sigma factor [Gemmatimonadaceae bacterium]|nr:sigma-70 family RNA polymerase sigma factor [Gemmatimonadaceae bacterium]
MSSELGDRADGRHEALVARVRANDPVAFEALYQMYVVELVQFVAGLVRSFEDAQDIVEDVFVTVWMRRAEWVPRYGARAYLFAAARNRALNARRDLATARRLGETAGQVWDEGEQTAGMGAPAQPIDEALDLADQLAMVERALATLPEVRRAVLELRLRQGMSGNEVAEVLGISRNAVDLHMSRGLRTLRELLPNLLDE